MNRFCGGKARTLASTEGFIYLFVRGFACVTWSSAKEPEAGDGKENEREPRDEVGGACRVTKETFVWLVNFFPRTQILANARATEMV